MGGEINKIDGVIPIKMNKNQLIVLWVSALSICSFIVFAPKKYLVYAREGRIYVYDTPQGNALTQIQWGFVFQCSLVTLLIGALLFYSFREKKN